MKRIITLYSCIMYVQCDRILTLCLTPHFRSSASLGIFRAEFSHAECIRRTPNLWVISPHTSNETQPRKDSKSCIQGKPQTRIIDYTIMAPSDRLNQVNKHLNYPAGMLAGQVAIITGAGQGIGAEAARLFANEGAKVVVADIDSSTCHPTGADEPPNPLPRHMARQCISSVPAISSATGV